MAKESFLEKEYGLKRAELFKRRSATEGDLKLMVNREREQEKWDKVLEESKKTPNSNFLVFIIGDYGTGKTLSLFDIKKKTKNKEMYPIYLNFQSEEKISKPGVNFIQRVFRKIDFDSIETKKEKIERLIDSYPEVGTIFQEILKGQRQATLNRGRISRRKRLAKSFLVGDISPTKTQLEELDVVRKIDKVSTAKEYLIGLLYLLKTSGYPTLVILADEFEYLFSIVQKSKQSIMLAFLRELYDLRVDIPEQLKENTANIALFTAVSSDGWDRLNDLEKKEKSTGGPITPLKRRASDLISLEGLDRGDTIRLIEKTLSFNRIEGVYEDEPLIPYTEDFADYIFKLTRGTPADINTRCDHVLDKGLEEQVPRLTKEFAKRVFKERGLSFSP